MTRYLLSTSIIKNVSVTPVRVGVVEAQGSTVKVDEGGRWTRAMDRDDGRWMMGVDNGQGRGTTDDGRERRMWTIDSNSVFLAIK